MCRYECFARGDFVDLRIYRRRKVDTQGKGEPMTAWLHRCLCVDYPGSPFVRAFRIVKLMDSFREASQKVIKS